MTLSITKIVWGGTFGHSLYISKTACESYIIKFLMIKSETNFKILFSTINWKVGKILHITESFTSQIFKNSRFPYKFEHVRILQFFLKNGCNFQMKEFRYSSFNIFHFILTLKTTKEWKKKNCPNPPLPPLGILLMNP
jgi:hypothetical protein